MCTSFPGYKVKIKSTGTQGIGHWALGNSILDFGLTIAPQRASIRSLLASGRERRVFWIKFQFFILPTKSEQDSLSAAMGKGAVGTMHKVK